MRSLDFIFPFFDDKPIRFVDPHVVPGFDSGKSARAPYAFYMERGIIHIDGFGPIARVTPKSVPELGNLVRSSAADGQAIYPVGGQTLLDHGLPPTRAGIGVDLRSLSQVIDYPARDMTITVQAGITVARLQELLATENQRLPIDVPQPDRATLGGALAVNISGPHRYGFGTLRDYVLGISVVNDEGQETKAGGRVVKNVAGYDFCKLHVGALGTLGMITQVTLKLKPRPPEQAMVLIACETTALASLLDQVHQSRTRPVCLDLLNQAAVQYINRQNEIMLPDVPWLVVIGFEDNEATARWQTQQVVQELSGVAHLAIDTLTGPAVSPLWRALTEFYSHPTTRLTFKASMLPRSVSDFCLRAASLTNGLMLQAHTGDGIMIGHTDSDLTLERAQTMLNSLHDWVRKGQGNLIILRCPSLWKKTLPVWGVARDDVWLMRATKEKLDPRGLFNPGRFVDGI